MWTVCKCLGIDLASRKRWQCGQCTLVRVAWAEPGLPVSGRDMWEDWLEDWREDLRFLDEVRVDEWRVEELRVDEWRVEEESGTPDTHGAIAALADAEALSSLRSEDSSDLMARIGMMALVSVAGNPCPPSSIGVLWIFQQ